MKKRIKLFYIIVLMTGLSGLNLHAQIFSPAVSQNKSKKDLPTVITSDSMDFDMTKNIAVFTGNVQVDDTNMRILCHKMIVRFEGKVKKIKSITDKKDGTEKIDDKKKKDDGEKKKDDDKKKKPETKVKEIECIKNVIIIRKQYDKKGDEVKEGLQKARAGHALYDVKTGKIILTDNPELIKNQDVLRGETIIYWINSGRVNVRSGNKNRSEIKMRGKKKGAK